MYDDIIRDNIVIYIFYDDHDMSSSYHSNIVKINTNFLWAL